MRVGVVILPQQRWSDAAQRWRRVEELGFDHAWTYDHLSWRSLRDEPWFATVPTLVAAATVTSRVRLGTWVASPNFRHPVPFAKELMSLDDISDGRFLLGVGSGGVGADATVMGQARMTVRDRAERFAEFVELLDHLLRETSTTWNGRHYTVDDARMLPGGPSRPRLPFVVAANGPKGMALAARFGEGWATTGPGGGSVEGWWAGVAEAARLFHGAVVAAGRDPGTVGRYLSVDAGAYALASMDTFLRTVERAQRLGYTDVVTHWPRARGIYAGEESVLEEVAARLPSLR